MLISQNRSPSLASLCCSSSTGTILWTFDTTWGTHMSIRRERCLAVQGKGQNERTTPSVLRTTKLLRLGHPSSDSCTRTYPIARAATFLAMENASTFPLRQTERCTPVSSAAPPRVRIAHPSPTPGTVHEAPLLLLPKPPFLRTRPSHPSREVSRCLHHGRHRECSKDDVRDPPEAAHGVKFDVNLIPRGGCLGR